MDWPAGHAVAVSSSSHFATSHGTRIVPVMDAPLDDEENVLWCGAFQLAWNEACEKLGGPIQLAPPSPLAAAFDRREFDRKCIDEASVFVASGELSKVEAGIRSRNTQGLKILRQLHSWVGSLNPTFKQFVCYARLDKKLRFAQPFGALGDCSIGEKSTPCFGFFGDEEVPSRIRRQVAIHRYHDRDDFIVELKTTEPQDMLILARTAPGRTLAETAHRVARELRQTAPSAEDGDVLVVPDITFQQTAAFAELEGRRIAGGTMTLTHALQSTDFAMDEKGATLHSDGGVSFACSAKAPKVSQHVMILQPPFLLLMQRRAAPEPYLACWIANDDLLERK